MTIEQHKKRIISWMKEILINSFKLEDEKIAEDVAEDAYDIYCSCDDCTKYDAMEAAYEKYFKGRK